MKIEDSCTRFYLGTSSLLQVAVKNQIGKIQVSIALHVQSAMNFETEILHDNEFAKSRTQLSRGS